MSKKKKNHNPAFKKQLLAHQKNEYRKRIIRVAGLLTNKPVTNILTGDILDAVYRIPWNPVNFEAGTGVIITNKQLQQQKEEFSDIMKGQRLDIPFTGEKITLHDYFGPAMRLWLYLSSMQKNGTLPKALAEAFDDFINAEELFQDGIKWITVGFTVMGWDASEFHRGYIWFKFEMSLTPDGKEIQAKAKIYGLDPEVLNVSMDGNNRPVFRTGIPLEGAGVIWMNINTSDLPVEGYEKNTEIPVYIQNHAVNRLLERLDCLSNSMIFNSIFNAFMVRKTFIKYNGNIYVAFFYDDKKVGYLKLEIIERVAVIRTFLFLTHSNVPEGDKLNELIGFEKPDISYLNLDKLSTFVCSELRNDKKLYEIFQQAGCDSLFRINPGEVSLYGRVMDAKIISSYYNRKEEFMKLFGVEQARD